MIDKNLKRNKVVQVINDNKTQAFWDLKFCNFIYALEEYFEYHRLSIYEDDMVQEKIKETRRIVEAKVSILSLSLIIYLKAEKDIDGNWIYWFIDTDATKSPVETMVTPVPEDKHLNINGVNCVLFAFECAGDGLSIYAVPIDVAEALNLYFYNGDEVSRDVEFLHRIARYEVKHLSVHNYD